MLILIMPVNATVTEDERDSDWQSGSAGNVCGSQIGSLGAMQAEQNESHTLSGWWGGSDQDASQSTCRRISGAVTISQQVWGAGGSVFGISELVKHHCTLAPNLKQADCLQPCQDCSQCTEICDKHQVFVSVAECMHSQVCHVEEMWLTALPAHSFGQKTKHSV